MASYRQTAINRCLDAIGEAPVNSVNSGVPDAESASRMIDQVTREVLQAGWSCNRVENTKLTPDLDQIIKVPDTILSIDTTGRDKWLAVTVREDTDGIVKLFKVTDQSYQFTDSVYVDIIYLFDIDALPFPLQNYIAAKSARVFQESVMGSTSLDVFTKQREAEAWALLLDYEAEQDDANVLTDSLYMAYVTGRNNPISFR